MTLTIEFVPHVDAGDRTKWPGEQDHRPVSDLGRAQAIALAEALAQEPVDALYSSPAVRCQQSLAPLAQRCGLSVAILPELREMEGFVGPEAWLSEAFGGAYAAGRALVAVEQIRTAHDEGRVVVCSHGGVIPALTACLAGAHDLEHVPKLERRGQWYSVHFTEEGVTIELRDAGESFPR